MSDTITYRNATVEDIKQLANLRVQFLNELLTDDESQPNGRKLKSQLEDYFTKAFRNESIIVRVAEIKSTIVGTSTMVLWQLPIGYDGIDKNGKGYILNMFTIPKYRKKGICTKLLEDLKRIATQKKLHHLHLNATDDGIELYKKAGFVYPKYPELVLKMD